MDARTSGAWMPYSGPDDKTLPADVKKLSATKRRAFVGAFNSTIKANPDDEARAFATAHAAANKAGEKAMPDDMQQGEKHDGGLDAPSYGPVPVVVVDEYERPEPYGGATSFAELDRANEQSTRASALQYTFFQFGDLVQNALQSDDLTAGQKVERVRALVDELGPRIDMVARDPQVAFKAQGFKAAAKGSTLAEPDLPVTFDPGGFAAFKDAQGNWRWVAIHTNRYEDVTGEIFSEKSHRQFVEWVEGTKQYPPLRFWHVPVDLGPSDFIDYSDGFMVSSGTFYPGMKDAAERLSKMKGLGCSHGYLYRAQDLVDGVYENYRSFEISVLPVDKAANRLTQFIAGKDIPMISDEKRDAAVAIFGEEGVKAIDAATGQLVEAARTAGLAYKDLAAFGLSGGKEGTVPDETNTTATAVADPAATPAADTPAATTEGAAPEAAPAAADAPATEAAPAEGGDAPAEGAAEGDAPAGDGTEPPEADGTPSASTATPSGPIDAQAAKSIEPLLDGFKGMLDAALAPLAQQVAQQGADIAALKQSDDAKIAAAVQPRVSPSYFDAAASRAAATEVGEKDALPDSVQQGIADAERGAKEDGPLQGIEMYLAAARATAARGAAGDVE